METSFAMSGMTIKKSMFFIIKEFSDFLLDEKVDENRGSARSRTQ